MHLSRINDASRAEEQGFSDKILFRLTDGAAALSGLGITDYAICGMGGELIARIIDSAPHLKADGIRLILQPMTRQAHLREYLAKSGFRIIDEGYSAECSRYYLTILCEYDGVCRKISDFEAELGNPPPRASFSPEMKGYFDAKLRSLKKIATAKRAAGEADNTEEKILLEYERRM